MGKKRDKYFKSYIWTQTPTGLIRSKMIGLEPKGGGEEEADSDIPSMEDQDSEEDANITGVETF